MLTILLQMPLVINICVYLMMGFFEISSSSLCCPVVPGIKTISLYLLVILNSLFCSILNLAMAPF